VQWGFFDRAEGRSEHLRCSVRVMELDEQIPDSLLPLLIFSFFRQGDAAVCSSLRRINLLLRELGQFVTEQFSIFPFHHTLPDEAALGMIGCDQRLDARKDG
jgi:hypothetical protein